ncbi:MAG: SRPBCC family protein [Rhodoferax sp.]|uniref:SRPBCC family protein n=1 Tax=Rhodoferax sp. TaxID=50421 RepID=UPI00260B80AD|nr:SRPBCC family protein [Rhodoferax sp.]MDD5335805.1 SRPBCC family protein [Rhodoferax sp.]
MMGTARTRMLAAALFCLLSLACKAASGVDQNIDIAVQQNGDTFIIDATMEVPVSVDTAWEVMTDFDHMTSILGNLTVSKVISRNGNVWIVRQEGLAKYGPFSYSFESDRQIHLESKKRIVARNLTSTATRMDSEAEIVPLNQDVRIKYHIEMVPGSLLVRMFGLPFVRHEVEEQLQRMAREMTLRHATAESTGKTSASQD